MMLKFLTELIKSKNNEVKRRLQKSTEYLGRLPAAFTEIIRYIMSGYRKISIHTCRNDDIIKRWEDITYWRATTSTKAKGRTRQLSVIIIIAKK